MRFPGGIVMEMDVESFEGLRLPQVPRGADGSTASRLLYFLVDGLDALMKALHGSPSEDYWGG